MNTYRIEVSPDGQLQLFAENGTFASAAPALENLIGLLAENGLDLEQVDPAEQHRHDDPRVHVHAGGVTHRH